MREWYDREYPDMIENVDRRITFDRFYTAQCLGSAVDLVHRQFICREEYQFSLMKQIC